MKSRTISLGALLIAACASPAAHAQQSFRNTSAAQPSPGVSLFRQTYNFTRYGDDPTGLGRTADEFLLNTQFAYGISKDVAVIAELPLLYRDVDSDVAGVGGHDFGQGDLHTMVKWRIWQNDTGPIDTMRLSLLAGLDWPVGEDPFGNNGWDPMIGAVFTSIQDRHGVNAAARYKFNTNDRDDPPLTVWDGLEDTLAIDAAYLYRLAPDSYDDDSHGAWYLMAELNATYETNGDIEAMIAPGIMYEARNWVFEASIQLPLYEDLDHRPQVEYSIGIGLRYLF